MLLVGLVALGIQILGHDPADSTADQGADRAASDDRRESPRRSPSKATQDKPRSTGPVVPVDAIGGDAKTLEKALEELGYDADKVTIDSAAPKDSILGTVPAPGDPLESGQTILFGPVVDEAHLYGLLARCRSLGLRVVEMRQLPG